MTTQNPLVYWRDWWASLSWAERIAIIAFTVSILAIAFISPAWAADSMTAVEVNAILATVFAGIAAIVSAVGVAWGAIARRQIANKVQELHVSTNSRMDQLLALTRTAAEREGVARGRAKVHAEGDRAAAGVREAAAQKAAGVLETAAGVARDKIKDE